MAEADALLQIYLDLDLKKCSPEPEQLDIELWQQLEPVRRKALLRYWVSRVAGPRLNEKQVAEIVASVIGAKPDANPVYKLKNALLGRFQNKLYLLPKVVEVKDNLSIQADGQYDLGDGVLTISGLPAGEVLNVRRRQGGENCYPVGRGTAKSVKKLLQEAVIPPWFKEHWPLVFRTEKIVAIPGICVCEESYAEKGEFSVLWCPFSLSDLS
ncbi:tRNA lysidine(34) synthetase TilS [Neptuniibacter sp.]|uniref:tRNA lysidine(34) synthetase TilS n=1 Tax=Neptuniibacter sp. TaxID=1962643 RepID=UPI00345BC716